jgi:hypothetical protein
MTTKETARRPTVDSREIVRLVDQFERVYAGNAWHGDPRARGAKDPPGRRPPAPRIRAPP